MYADPRYPWLTDDGEPDHGEPAWSKSNAENRYVGPVPFQVNANRTVEDEEADRMTDRMERAWERAMDR